MNDNPLRIVHVETRYVVLSTGEEVIVKYDKLHALCEQLYQEQSPLTVRLWWTPDGIELVEAHRIGVASINVESSPNEAF